MTETPTTIRDTFAAQVALAIQALGIHMEAHRLPAFTCLDIRDHKIIVLTYFGTHDAWLATVAVDAERNELRHPDGNTVVRTEWDVRLPDTGFRFQLVGYRDQPLMAVSA